MTAHGRIDNNMNETTQKPSSANQSIDEVGAMAGKEKSYQGLKIETLPGSEIEISGEVPVSIVESYRKKAIQKLIKNIELPGFRKGHVPEDVALKHVGELELLQEIAEQALGKTYADIVADKALEVVGRPAVTITKLAPGNPIGFKIKSAVYPFIELPDYKKIAAEEGKKLEDPEKVTIEDVEIEAELTRIRLAMNPPAKDGEDGEKKVDMLPIDDVFAKTVGDFKDLADLKAKMKEQMLRDKKNKEYDKRRLTIADAVIAKSKVEVPTIFIEGELDQMVASFSDRVARAGMDLAGYLTQVGKTIEDLRKEWRVDAEKRAKLQLIFNQIALKEMIVPDEKKLTREIAHIKEHYPDVDESAVRTYVSAQITNEMVFELLDGGRKPSKPVEDAHVHDENCSHEH
ncbi:MAG: Trigger factor [Parcubacteria group bacterium GW2011_GWA2_43_11]|nr:MAG: Trigger factor [Parcubacteria group bacterium GW2011_GWC2_42_11]KKS85936.1 MAG: Trigger factor [Parcubacteria group bacterium GW2011_GWA2_43_11]